MTEWKASQYRVSQDAIVWADDWRDLPDYTESVIPWGPYLQVRFWSGDEWHPSPIYTWRDDHDMKMGGLLKNPFRKP